MENYKTETYHDATRFSGLIYASDFETEFRGKDKPNGSDIAKRIMSDWRFDDQCRRNCIARDMRKKKNKPLKENDDV